MLIVSEVRITFDYLAAGFDLLGREGGRVNGMLLSFQN